MASWLSRDSRFPRPTSKFRSTVGHAHIQYVLNQSIQELANMNLLEHLGRLLAYDDWANREVLASLKAAGSPPPRSLSFMAHILSVERLWLERLERQSQTFPVWPDFTLPLCEAQAAELPRLWKVYLGRMKDADLAQQVTYRNTKGETWANKRGDILLHVIMHSVYHRGQIATDMRAAGHTPAYTDFIHGVRQGLVE